MKAGTGLPSRTRLSALAVGLISLATALSACNTSPPAPEQMSRTVTETAPADLQLLCADAAAKAIGAAGSSVLPVTSRRIDSSTYQVDLNVGGSTRTCLINNTGNVLSVQPDGA